MFDTTSPSFTRPLTRRRLIALSALGGAGVALGPAVTSVRALTGVRPATTSSVPGELRSLNVQLGWIANVENAGEFVAAAKGYYAEEGLDPTLTPGGPGAILEPTVVSGAALVGLSNADTIARANAEGAGLKIVGVTLQNNPSAVMSLASNPVPDAKSLEGKKLGLQQSGEAIYDAFFELAGVDPSQVTIVPVQFDPAPLVAGEVDAFASFQTNQPIALAAEGIETVTFLLADYGYNIYADAFFVTEDTLADDDARDTVVRFLRATQRGWEDAIADPAAAAQIVVDGPGADLDLDVDQQTSTLEAFVPLIQTDDTEEHGLFWMSDEGIANNIATMKSVDIDVDESLFVNGLLEEL
jgi:ABC-type nitrate/sulfonate/bicarbonate transport system substrate-binding protein